MINLLYVKNGNHFANFCKKVSQFLTKKDHFSTNGSHPSYNYLAQENREIENKWKMFIFFPLLTLYWSAYANYLHSDTYEPKALLVASPFQRLIVIL